MKALLLSALAIVSLSACGTQDSAPTDTPAMTEPVPVMTAGQKLFVNNCVQCHNIKTDKIGPKLEGVVSRWDNDSTRLYAFIRNASESIKAGDPRAMKVYEEWNHALMTPMPHLTDGEINQILEYINAGKE